MVCPRKGPLEVLICLIINSFAILNNVDIVNLAADMGINIDCMQFESVEIMKDLLVQALAGGLASSGRSR
jgi:hypothetical protein